MQTSNDILRAAVHRDLEHAAVYAQRGDRIGQASCWWSISKLHAAAGNIESAALAMRTARRLDARGLAAMATNDEVERAA